jgi:hypothetical protein
MADPSEIDSVADAFRAQIEPQKAPAPSSQPRNDRGQFMTEGRPERLFEERKTEGDPETGDTSDGGDDKRLRGRERQVEEGADGEGLSDEEREAADEGGEGEGEPSEPEEGEGDEEEYEVTVDGEPKKVKLREALDGYIRTETFHQRMNKVSEAAQLLQQEVIKNGQVREYWLAQNRQLENELTGLIPKEPDWDAEFARDPQGANNLRKQFEALKSKLGEIRQQRAQVEQQQAQEQQQNIARFAAQEREKFVTRHKLVSKEAVDKEIASMRKTAIAEGFSEDEIAQVYDSRMLSVLMKASKYDRMMANKLPKAVIPGKGKTLTPGSVAGRPNGRSGREGIDAVQRKLAASGSIEDAASFFKTVLR